MKERIWMTVLVGLALPLTASGRDELPDWVHRDSADCGRCHAAIEAEWRTSLHSRSTLERDPLYRLMQEKAVKALGKKAEEKCRGCHYPPWESAAARAGVKVEGVSCVVCHRVHPKHPEVDLKGGRAAVFALGDGNATGLCLACHDELKNPQGHPVCTTGPEAARAGNGTCKDCHMPGAAGPPFTESDESRHASHRFPGGTDRAFVKGTARVSLSVQGKGEERKLLVRVQVKGVGHSLPTGNPMRSLLLRVSALDAGGKVIWTNATGDPLKEAPDSVFMRVFSDAEGKAPVPPFMAVGPSRDNRLQPGEVRIIRYPLPAGAKSVNARLEYSLAPAKLLKKAGYTESEAAPVIVSESRLSVTAD